MTEARVQICAQQAGTTLGCGEFGPLQVRYHEVLKAFPTPPSHPYTADWSGRVSLAGYDLGQQGNLIALTLYWQAGRVPPGPLKRFVHAVDAAGEMVAQADDELRTDGIPLSQWQPGEVSLDRIELRLAPGGPVTALYVGLYDPDSGERLPVQPGTAVGASDGRIQVPTPSQ